MWSIGFNQFPRIYMDSEKNIINYIKLEQVTEPIMRGIDYYNRKFLIVKYLINNKIYIDCYLQVSPLWETIWVTCGKMTKTLFPYRQRLTNFQIGFIEQIMQKKILQLKPHHAPYDLIYEGEVIKLYNK